MRIKNGDLSLDGTDMESNIISEPIWLAHIAYYSIQVVFTGSPDGSFKLQASNDEGKNDVETGQPNITNWTDIEGSTQAISSSGDHTYSVADPGYRWVRLVWTDSSSSSATITSARFNVKGA